MNSRETTPEEPAAFWTNFRSLVAGSNWAEVSGWAIEGVEAGGRTLKSLVSLLFSSTAYRRFGSLNTIQLAEVPGAVSLATMLKEAPSKSAAATMPEGPPPTNNLFAPSAAELFCRRYLKLGLMPEVAVAVAASATVRRARVEMEGMVAE